jgi:hypothetical protein
MSLSTHSLHLEITSFIDGLESRRSRPGKPSSAGRAIRWDKNLNLADQADYGEARVAQQVMSMAPTRTRTATDCELHGAFSLQPTG